MKLKILISPLHYVLDRYHSGSEFSWAYNLYTSFSSSLELKPIFITGGLRGIDDKRVINCKIFNPAKIDSSLISLLKFYWATYWATKKSSKGFDYQILHHVLPFHIDRSFNLFALTSSRKFVLGPLQSPLLVHDHDLSPKDTRGFTRKKMTLALGLEALLLTFIDPLLLLLSKKTLKRADKVLAMNQHTYNLLIEKGVSPEKISIIPFGINSIDFKFVPFKENSSSTIQIITVGLLLHRKAVDLVIRSMAEILKFTKKFHLNIIGDGPQRKNLENLTQKLHLEDHVTFHGFIKNNEMHKYYCQSNIFVSMSRSESWGQMYLEAMASGLPIITAKNVGSQEIVQEGKTGFLVEQEDYKSLARKILDLEGNRKKIAAMGMTARKTVETKYCWSKIIPKYLKLYEQLAHSPQSRK